ncbi:hypothetical protein PFISCL1PPCAC_26724, partial [Pristionchus fissidentatus]
SEPRLRIRTPGWSSESVWNVLGRLPKWISDEFSAIRITGTNEELSNGSARIVGSVGGIEVEATSGVDALYAIHVYLREFCGTMITWEGSNVPMEGECKRPQDFERKYDSKEIRYFGNPCTYSYSFAWWDWAHWERFIDWLALSGFNMVLTPVGQEAIWAKLWSELGISESGLNDFFSGPAFLAWHRMGNVQKLGGPMSVEYLESQLELNKKIVNRLVELGIVPVLPTFAGFVPKEFERKHPDLQYLHNACWNNLNETYSCTTSLHPQEPHFKKIAKLFVEMQSALYGEVTDVYSADPFNESPPAHLTESEVAQMSSAIHQGCSMGNEKCIWLLQSWTFAYDGWKKSAVESFLTRVPVGRMIILDLQAEKRALYKEFDGFFGHFFVWCLLQNFGGNTQMRGNLGKLHENYRTAVDSVPSMAGMGLTMEGINQNYVVYQYMIDLAWTNAELHPMEWINGYASARYGANSSLESSAWKLLLSTFYTQLNYAYDPYFLLDSPEFNEREERREIFIYFRPKFTQRIRYWFPAVLIEKLGKMFTVLNRTLGTNELFRQDYADVMREVIQEKLGKRINYVDNGYALQDNNMMKKGCADVAILFDLLDKNEVRDLSSWIMMARNAARPKGQADSFERQARNQLTLWGPTGEIPDYARKEWSGLIKKFYAKRWAFFCDYVQSGVRYNQNKFEEKLFNEVELPFAHL